MSTSKRKPPLLLEDPKVLAINADAGNHVEPGATWAATVFDPEDGIGTPDHRVVTATLSVHSESGAVHVAVGGLFSPLPLEFGSVSDLTGTIRGSVALETLYDFARVAARTAGAMVDVQVELPLKSPDAEVLHISEVPDGDDNQDPEAHDK